MTVRVAVIGCGSWGLNHVRAATKLAGADLIMVCDPSTAARERALQAAPGARAVEHPEEVFREPGLDAVLIASPAPSHARLARAALDAGKHVLVEKPFVLDPVDGQDLVARAEAQHLTLMVGHLLRYHPYFRRLVSLARAGELGRVHYVYSERVNLGPMRSGENALWSLAPHDVSMMCALIEAQPIEVSSTGQAYLQRGVEDVVFATIRFADDTLGHVHTSWLHPQKRRRLTVVGSTKLAVFDDMEPSEKLRIYDRGGLGVASVGFEQFFDVREGDIHTPSVRMVEPLTAEQQHFIDCIRTRQRPETDGEEALRVVRCLTAAMESLEAGGRPVRLAKR